MAVVGRGRKLPDKRGARATSFSPLHFLPLLGRMMRAFLSRTRHAPSSTMHDTRPGTACRTHPQYLFMPCLDHPDRAREWAPHTTRHDIHGPAAPHPKIPPASASVAFTKHDLDRLD